MGMLRMSGLGARSGPGFLLFSLLGMLGMLGCERAAGVADARTAESITVHVDSLRPVSEEIQLFQASVGEPVAALTGGADSAEELVARLLGAATASDWATAGELLVSPREFAYLYYPQSSFTRPPYQMPPSLLWLQLENASASGLQKVMGRFGGHDVRLEEVACATSVVEGDLVLWQDCSVRVGTAAGVEEVSLFAAVMEYRGQFKFLSYGNRL